MRKRIIIATLAVSLLSTLCGASVFAMDAADVRPPLVKNVLGFYPEVSMSIFDGAMKNILSASTTARIDDTLEAFSHNALENLEGLRKIEQAIQSFDASPNAQLILADLHQFKSTITTLKLEITELGELQKRIIVGAAASSTDAKDPRERIGMLHQSIQRLLIRQKELINRLFNEENYRVYEPYIHQMQASLAAQEVQQNAHRERVGEASYRRTHGTKEERESVCPDHLVLGRATTKVIPDFTPALFDAFSMPDVTSGERRPMATAQLNGKLWKVFALEKTTGPIIPPAFITNVIASRMGIKPQEQRVQRYYSKHINDSSSGIIWKKVEDRSDDLGGTICVYQSAVTDSSSMQQQYGYNPMNGVHGHYSIPTRSLVYTFAFVPAEAGDVPIVRQDTIARQTHYAKRMHAMRQQGFEPIPFKDLPNLHKDSAAAYEEKVRAVQERTRMEMKERIARARVHALQNGTVDRESHEQVHASRIHKAGKLLHSPSTRLSKQEIEFYGSDKFTDTLPTQRQIHQFMHQPGMPAVAGRQTMSDAVNQRVARGLIEVSETRRRMSDPTGVVDEDRVYEPGLSSQHERRVHGRMEKGATIIVPPRITE